MIDALDLIQIHQLLGRYGHSIDHRQWEVFEGLFTPDASIDYRGSTGAIELSGRDAIVDWFKKVSHPPAHHVTNIVADDADEHGRVAVHSKFIAPFTRDPDTPKRLYGGDYHDVCVKTEHGWQFVFKQCIPRWNLAVAIDETAPEHRRTF